MGLLRISPPCLAELEVDHAVADVKVSAAGMLRPTPSD
jgi:hypothetical protein